MDRKADLFIFDIETGGLKPVGEKASSILSASYTAQGAVRETFAQPEPGTWLSKFSKENIIPQLKGKVTGSEKDVIRDFIQGLRSAPKGAPIVGYNIQNFDIPFMRARARAHGLEGEFLNATRGRRQIDIGLRTKQIVGSAIQSHIERGIFYEQLGNRTWGQAQVEFEKLPYQQRPPEYRMLKQMESFAKEMDRGGAQTVIDKQARGWKLEQIFPLIDSDFELAGKAHQSSADVLMTRRLFEAIGTGELQQKAQTPEFAKGWLSSTVEGLARAPSAEEKAAGEIFYPNLRSKLWAKWKSVPKPARKFAGGTAIFAGGLAATAGLVSIFSDEHMGEQRIEGLSHAGVAQSIRRNLTDFSSPVDLAKAAARADEMYQGLLKQLFKQKGIDPTDITFSSTVAAQKSGKQELTLFAKSKEGKNLATLNRGFSDKGVDLSFVYVDPSLQGGFGKSLYKAEEDIFRQIGYEAGEEITSTVVSPLTARMQHQQYGSRIDETSLWDLEETADSFYKRLLNKEITMDDMPMLNMTGQLGYKPPNLTQHKTGQGMKTRHTAQRMKQIQSTPISGGDDSRNKVEGLKHGGLGQWLRKMFTPFGSGWDKLRGLLKQGEVFEDMIGSVGFKQALAKSKEVKTLNSGLFGKAVEMEGEFRGQSFKFVRKHGSIGEHEVSTMRTFQDRFAPTVYGEDVFAGKGYIDMELFEGKTFGSAFDEGLLTDAHKAELVEHMKAIHGEGLVHGDIHWGNAYLTNEGKVGVIDYGTSGKVGTQIEEMMTETGEYGIPKTLAGKTYEWRTPLSDLENLASMGMYGKMSDDVMASLQAKTGVSIKKTASPATEMYMAGGLAGAAAQKVIKSGVKTPVQVRGKMNKAASATMSEAGRNGGRKSRMG